MSKKREIFEISIRLAIMLLFLIIEFTLFGYIIYAYANSDLSNAGALFFISQKTYIGVIFVISIIAIVTTIRIVISCIDLHNAIKDRKALFR